MTEFISCPACNYTRQPTDNVPDWECPGCHKAYNKTARAVHEPMRNGDPSLAFNRPPQQIEKHSGYDYGNPPISGNGTTIKNVVLTFFMFLAAIGLFLSVLVHLCALSGFTVPFAKEAWGLHGGIFVVWLPAVIVAQKLSKDFKQKDLWKAALRGCPTWMKYVTYFFFGYAILNFAIFILGTSVSAAGKGEMNQLRGFSGHWMAFYSAAMAILYSATHYESSDKTRKCLNGHTVSPLANFCEECGAPVMNHPYN